MKRIKKFEKKIEAEFIPIWKPIESKIGVCEAFKS